MNLFTYLTIRTDTLGEPVRASRTIMRAHMYTR